MCECLAELRKRLEPEGLEMNHVSLVFPKDGSKSFFIPTFPLVQLGTNRKPKNSQPNTVAPAYCPFCGQKYQ
jgi:hypothetical protein